MKKYDSEIIEEVLTSAMYGGIGYWACLDNDCESWDRWKRRADFIHGEDSGDIVTECIRILYAGGELEFFDTEDSGTRFDPLTLDKLIKGIESWEDLHGSIRKAIDDGAFDSYEADTIVQFALFGELVYG